MATVTAHPTPAVPASRWPYLLAYLAAVIAAEVLIAIPGTSSLTDRPFPSLGLGLPLLVSVAAVAYVQRLRPRDLGLAVHRWQEIVQQTAIALTGIPLGLVEFFILRSPRWIAELTFGSLVLGGIVIFFATGFSEELI